VCSSSTAGSPRGIRTWTAARTTFLRAAVRVLNAPMGHDRRVRHRPEPPTPIPGNPFGAKSDQVAYRPPSLYLPIFRPKKAMGGEMVPSGGYGVAACKSGEAAGAPQEAHGAHLKGAFVPLFCKVTKSPLQKRRSNTSIVAEVVIL
jgi:hypothetical protein